MQFREVGGRVQVLASVYDPESKRTRQKMVMSLPKYGQPATVTVDQLEDLADDRREAYAAEINVWLAARAAERRQSDDRVSAGLASRALRQAAAVLRDRPEAVSDGDVAQLAEALREASKVVANRARSIAMKARKQSTKKAVKQSSK